MKDFNIERKGDWVTGLFEGIERIRHGTQAKPVPFLAPDAELLDAVSSYVGRLGLLTGKYRKWEALGPADQAIVDMVCRGVMYCAAAAVGIPGSDQWKQLTQMDDDREDDTW